MHGRASCFTMEILDRMNNRPLIDTFHAFRWTTDVSKYMASTFIRYPKERKLKEKRIS